VCLGDCSLDTCVPPPEVCNGVDDDCDAAADDGFACVAGSTLGTCGTSCGSIGTQSCTSMCTPGSCTPPLETCNGLDDDCDGPADETFPCVAGTSLGTCPTTCGSTGNVMCTASCTVGTCTPPPEVCNGVDDDCDTACDEGFTCCAGATTDCGVLGAGTGTATCTTGCAWDTSGCDTAFDPTGTYLISPPPTYTCAFGLVNFSIGTMTYNDTGTNLYVTGAPCLMAGPSAVGGNIDVTCTLPGTCDEIYSLEGMYTDADTWTGTFTAEFMGSCFGCTYHSWAVTGTR
jgi:hypothetical protein